MLDRWPGDYVSVFSGEVQSKSIETPAFIVAPAGGRSLPGSLPGGVRESFQFAFAGLDLLPFRSQPRQHQKHRFLAALLGIEWLASASQRIPHEGGSWRPVRVLACRCAVIFALD